MSTLKVQNITKTYESFKLDNVSFSLDEGKITGFIGRNGAGKSTTLKSILNFVHPDCGNVEFFGLPFAENEFEIKQKIGFVSGGVDYYSKKKIKVITNVTKRFYSEWDEKSYLKYMEMFNIDENKTPFALSAGMKVKYALVLALSHNAQLLILDEPTSGLDPVSRDELLEVFLTLCDEGKTIFFSTHITSDLDKCADNIIYIRKGKIIADMPLHEFSNSYKVAEFKKEDVTDKIKPLLIGTKRSKEGYTALIHKSDSGKTGFLEKDADLEEIMVHMEKEE